MRFLLKLGGNLRNSFLKKRKIRFALILAFMALFSLSSTITMTYTYLNLQQVMDVTSRDLISKTQKIIIEDVMNYMNAVARLIEVGAWLEKNDTTALSQDENLLKYMTGVLKTLPQVNIIYVSDPKGNYLGLGRIPDKRVFLFQQDQPLPHESVYYLNRISRLDGQARETRDYLNQDLKFLIQESNPSHTNLYDPRTRPWYQQTLEAKKLNWTPIYADWETSEFLVTISKPLFDEKSQLIKIISADIQLYQISKLLAQQKASQSGLNFIIDAKGQLIGYPQPEQMVREANGQRFLATLDDLGDVILQKAYGIFKKTHKSQFMLTHENIDYLVYFVPFPEHFEKKWTLGMVAPADDFIGALKHTNRTVIAISFLILALACLILVVFSHRVSAPIEYLAKQMGKIKDLEIEKEDDFRPRSSLEEISQMEHALESMKEGLASFSKFVPKSLVKRLIQSGREAKLGGERKKLVILFSDIAGFTSISEKMTSDQLVQHLSDYLSDLSQIILNYHGTIDKYIGDAIMAFWGAPDEDDHMLNHACAAALTCAKHVEHKNKIWKAQGLPALPTRFGLHYGDVIVGNVGSADRLNYTVIGDNVNLASRLEGINKVYGSTITVSEPLYTKVKSKFLFRPLDLVTVKGKDKAVRIYELMGKLAEDPQIQATPPQHHVADLTHQGFEAYLKRKWTQAQEAYRALAQNQPQDPLAALYLERCQEFLKNPPPKNWDGVYHAKVK